MKNALSFTILVAVLAGCGGGGATPDVAVVDGPGTSSFKGEVWADNWFAFYLGDRLIIEDSVSITTERSLCGGSPTSTTKPDVPAAGR